MKPFTKKFGDLTPKDVSGLTKQLRSHPVIQAQVKRNDITAQQAINDVFKLWQAESVEPVHDTAGKIIGFRPVDGAEPKH